MEFLHKFFEDHELRFIEQKFEELLSLLNKYPVDKINLIRRAVEFAYEAHTDNRRQSGEPFIIHPIEVAIITISEIGLDIDSAICAIMHDIVEDTEHTLDDITQNFGQQYSDVIDGLTKINDVYDGKNIQIENFKKILLSIPENIHIILIKLADRLHNMRTMDAMPKKKQFKKAGETLHIYAPLAHKLGLYEIKNELEDLSFKYREEEKYKALAATIKESQPKRDWIHKKFEEVISPALTSAGYNFKIIPRIRSIYSTYQKCQTEKLQIDEMSDFFAIRIVFQSKPSIAERIQCFEIYSHVTEKFYPKSLVDRIIEKKNSYEALHAKVMGPHNDWIEVQILSERMDEISRRGYAATEKYIELHSSQKESKKWIETIKDHLNDDSSSIIDIFEDIRQSIFSSEIYVFTPKGEIKILPRNSTVLDFAFELHTEIGSHCIGAIVNHKNVSKRHILQNADQVEVLTAENQSPNEHWIDIVSLPKAKDFLRDYFKKEKSSFIEQGKLIFDEFIITFRIDTGSSSFKSIYNSLYYKNMDDFYYRIGKGEINNHILEKTFRTNNFIKLLEFPRIQVTRFFDFLKFSKNSENKDSETKELQNAIILDGSNYNLAECCNPIPGDSVVGFQTANGTITLHNTECSKANKLAINGSTEIHVEWITSKFESFLVRLKIEGIDRLKIAAEITHTISQKFDVNMKNLNLRSDDSMFFGEIDLYVYDTKHLNTLIEELKNLDGITSVERFTLYE